MNAHFKPGFTIIETMLVLAITGVLIAGLFVGIGSSISTQRYADSVMSFKALLQDQYSKVNNMSNDRDASWTCGVSAEPTQVSGGIAPGQSDCVLLGRYIAVVNGDITTASVVGYEASSVESGDDISTIKNNYNLGISPSSVETTKLEWGAKISWPLGGSGSKPGNPPRSIAMLIIRSPESGTTYTFTGDNVNTIGSVSTTTLKAMIVDAVGSFPGRGERTICIDPNGVNVPDRLAVSIATQASGPSSIETRSYATIIGMGKDSRC